jgi:hypothetical protein
VLRLVYFGKLIRNTCEFEMGCWRRMEKISWTDHVRNRVEEERNILRPINKKPTWTGHILHRNCLLEHKTEGYRGDTGNGKTRKKT